MIHKTLFEVPVNFPPSLANQGFRLWKWLIPLDVFKAPLEPLTQGFWSANFDSALVYGIIFAAVYAKEGGNLLVLLSQQLRKNPQCKFGGLSQRQRRDIHKVILEIDDIQVRGIRIVPEPLRQEIITGFESFFDEYILPRMDENGNYYRKVPEEESYILKPDQLGKFQCARCRRMISYSSGAMAMETYPVDDGTFITVTVCKHCGEILLVQSPGR
jgi:hypothetical protein